MANEWKKGTGTALAGGDAANTIDNYVADNIQEPLERLLNGYQRNCVLSYASVAAVSVAAGEICCSNAAGDIRKFRQNLTATSVGWAKLDAGIEAISTTYYVYATADADATDFDFLISVSAIAPTGGTYYKRIGSFYNNASGDISAAWNDTNYYCNFGAWASKTANTVYQAQTDGIACAYTYPYTTGCIFIYTDASNPPTTGRVGQTGNTAGGGSGPCVTSAVRKGDYYKIYYTVAVPTAIYWIPLGA